MTSQDELAKYFALIGVRNGASLYEVKTAYRAISAQSHPDNFELGSPDHLAAQEAQKALNQAYECLKRHLQASGDTGKPPKEAPVSAKSPSETMDETYSRVLAIEKGQGQPADLLKAIEGYKRLAMMGHAKSQFRLGFLYFDSVMKDLPEAYSWWKRAAENGHVGAQFNLALMYERGYGAPKDDAEAFRWFKEAATRGDKQAWQKLVGMGVIKPAGTPTPTATTPVHTPAAEKAAAAEPALAQSGLASMFLKKRPSSV